MANPFGNFGDEFIKGFFGSDYLKDYRHAAKTFLSNGGEYLPRQKFLYHVYFNMNTDAIPQLAPIFGGLNKGVVGLMVKSIQLPSFRMGVETLNQYNRKRLIQTKVEYDPIQVQFHDDGADLIRKMWYNYFTYYFSDSDYSYAEDRGNNYDYNDKDPYRQDRIENTWGLNGLDPNGRAVKPSFFRDIRIYGFAQHRVAEYILINPMIENWQSDQYDYSQSEGMTNTMTIRYEAVKYKYSPTLNGVTGAPAIGFAQVEHYDKERSSLGRPGGTASILGQGGLVDVATGVSQDISQGNILGAIQKIGAAKQSFKGKKLKDVATQEGVDVLQKVLRTGTQSGRQFGAGPGGFTFPTPGQGTGNRAGGLLSNPPGPNIFVPGDF